MTDARDVRIRGARAHEAGALTRLAIAAKASWGYPAEWLDRWRDELTITPAYLRSHRVLVAEDSEGIVLGMIAVEVEDERAEIAHLWIRPDAQRRGVGAALLRAAVAAAPPVPLHVTSDPQAVEFYRRHGARVIGRVAAPMPGAPERVLPVLAIEGRET